MKKLNIAQTFKDFDGTPLTEGDKKEPVTLKSMLMYYLRSSGSMGLNDNEQTTAYETGFVLAQDKPEINLTKSQYDVIKKLADYGKIKQTNGQEVPAFPIIYIKQCQALVDAAENIDEKPEPVKETK